MIGPIKLTAEEWKESKRRCQKRPITIPEILKQYGVRPHPLFNDYQDYIEQHEYGKAHTSEIGRSR